MDPETPAPTPPPETPQSLTAALRPPNSRGRTGKVARLPKALRDQINMMILDGAPYLEIIDKLGLQTHGITEKNLSNWKPGGYIDWLRELHFADAIQTKHELAESIVARSGDDNAAGQAVLQVIATNLCEFLVETDPATLRESLLSDSDKFTRFVNSMVRLAEGGIKCEIHKFRAQDRTAETARRKAPAEQPGISDESLLKAEQKLKLM